MTAWQVYIKATGEQSAEMVTDEGAIYVTSNRGYNWKAAVQETVSATLNRYNFFYPIDAETLKHDPLIYSHRCCVLFRIIHTSA